MQLQSLSDHSREDLATEGISEDQGLKSVSTGWVKNSPAASCMPKRANLYREKTEILTFSCVLTIITERWHCSQLTHNLS